MNIEVKTALISVYDKTGILEFAKFLDAKGVKILSTGGSAKILRDSGINVVDVSDHTGFPEMLDGRVKTLHPKIHGGLLGRRDLADHMSVMQKHGIEQIDMLVVNLYPFEETVKSGASHQEIIENIDIGGPAMIRSAAKNHSHVNVITSPDDYAEVINNMNENYGRTTIEMRKKLAYKAYAKTAAYDSAISSWFASGQDTEDRAYFSIAAKLQQPLRYGENPHQKAGFYSLSDGEQDGTLAGAKQVHGKELSYNNINDTDAAWQLVNEFSYHNDGPAVAIIKHANPCGVATASSLEQAYENAFQCDAKSAFGGIIALNGKLDAPTAQVISKQFAEVVIAPEADDEAIDILSAKKNLRILLAGYPEEATNVANIKTISGGLLVQSADNQLFSDEGYEVVTKREPSADELQDLIFAFKVTKHVKSNAIVMAKGGTTIGIGAGQMSRVDSVHLAGRKADEAGISTKGAALSSDAFFPFDDNVHAAAKSGITSIIQPGGSIRDEEVIKAADKYNMAMIFTKMRHFRH